MENRPKKLICFLLFCVVALTTFAPAANGSLEKQLSAHELLQSYGFPQGILPKNVQNYSLDSDGNFVVEFSSSCKFSVHGGYTLQYKKTISGHIKTNSISNLKGVKVKVWFFWLDITGLDREGDTIEFHVGVLSASFDVSNFYEIPECGCGFDCVSSEFVAVEVSR